MLKLGTRTRTHAVVLALTLGEITLQPVGIPSEPQAGSGAAEPHRARRPRAA
jgi:hypothetical protein